MRSLCSARPASRRCSRILKAFPQVLEDEPGGIHQVRPRTSVPQFPRIRRVSVRRHRRRDQEGAAPEGGLLRARRPDAVDARARRIQHILLTRTPAITGVNEFLSFDTPQADGRGLPNCSTRSSPLRTCRPLWTARIAGSPWRLRGMGFARLARPRNLLPPSPTSSARAWRRARTSSGTLAQPLPNAGSAAWPERHLHAIAILSRAPTSSAGARSRSTTVVGAERTASGVCPTSTSTRHHCSTTPTTDFGFRGSALAAGDEGFRRGTDARIRDPLEPGEFILGYPDENGPVANLPEPEVFYATAATWRTGGCKKYVGAFRRTIYATTPTPRRVRNCSPPSSWAAGAAAHHSCAGAGQGRSRARCRSNARNNDYNYKRDGSVRLRVSARLACPPVESP